MGGIKNYNLNERDPRLVSIISEIMDVESEDIKDLVALKKGMTNISFKFSLNDKRYIIRIPGEGTDKLVSRRNECEVYRALEGARISDEVIYISPENGYKISRFIPGSRACDPHNIKDVRICMEKLKEFHGRNFEVDHRFDLYETLNYYESLWMGELSTYPDYLQTKEKIESLRPIIEASDRELALSHIDAVPDNFLITDEDIRLIDWEYSGMQDPHVDIAMFAISAAYDREEVDRLIDIYFEGECEDRTRIKIYCYIALAGLLWSNWSEYKRLCGVGYPDYARRQYEYAREYYEIVMDEMARVT